MLSKQLKTENSNWFVRIIEMIMISFLAIYPFGIAGMKGISDVMRYWDGTFLRLTLLFGLAIILVCFAVMKCTGQSGSKYKASICFILFTVAFVLRVGTCIFLPSEPISDFATCYYYASSGAMDESLSKYPYLGMYAISLKVFFRIFGVSLINAQVFNALITSLIPVLIFLGADKMVERNAALASSAFYALYPGTIIYCAITSCEHFSQFFLALGFVLLSYSEYYKEKKVHYYCFRILSGASFGMMYLYKEIFIVVAPAILMAYFCYEILPAFINKQESLVDRLQNVWKITANILLVIIVAMTVYQIGVYSIRVHLKTSDHVYRPRSFAASLYQGLAIEGRGQYSADVNNFIEDAFKNADTKKEADITLYDQLRAGYQERPVELLNVLKEKFTVNWINEGIYYYWACEGRVLLLPNSMEGNMFFNLVPSFTFALMSLLTALGLAIQIFKKQLGRMNFAFVGIVFLFSIALILIEAQGRYKSNIMPVISILFGISSVNIVSFLKSIRNRFRKARTE